MPPLFDPRRMARTPGFAPDGLYDDEQEPMPPLPDRIVPPGQQSQMGLGGMVNAAPAQLEPIREFDSPRQNPMLNPPPRQRIQLPSAPLPPKVGKMRQILGHAAAVFMPEVGTEIAAPGYSREVREYNAQKQRLMDEAKINEAAAQEEYHVANSRAAMARAEASNAQRDRTRGQMNTDADFTLGGDQARFDHTGRRIAINPLPPKPQAAGVKIGRDGRPFFEEGQQYVELPAGAVPSVVNSTPRPDKGIAEISEIVSKQMPTATQEERDAKIVQMWTERRKLDEDKKRAETDRAKRPYPVRGTGPSPTETRLTIDEQAKAAIAEAGDVDAAIAAATDEKILLHLKAMKGSKIANTKTTIPATERRRRRRGDAPAPATPNSGKVKLKAPNGEVMEVDAGRVEHYISRGAKRL